MKILKIFGIVFGIHVFAFVFIFANQGCSSKTRQTPAPTDTAGRVEPAPQITVPSVASAPLSPAPMMFNPDAPAVAASSGGFRAAPTRPGTPVANVLVAEPVQGVTPAMEHVVVSGDNLWNLSKKHGLTSAQLAAANNLKTSATLKPGQKLIIPGKVGAAPGAAPAAPAASLTKAGADTAVANAAKAAPNQMKHTVRSGESLSVIARQYGVRQNDIVLLNNITDPAMVKAGTELIIPEWQPVGKNGKSGQKAGESPKSSSAKAPPVEAARPPTKAEPAAPPPLLRPDSEIPVIRVDEGPVGPGSR